MIKKEVLLEIKSRHTAAGADEEDEIALRVPGFYELQNGIHKVSYEEEITDVKKSIKNTLIFSDKNIELIREGFISSHMNFDELGKNTLASYATPYGKLEMEIQTYKVNIDKNEDYILAEAHYSVSIDKRPVSECRLRVQINLNIPS